MYQNKIAKINTVGAPSTFKSRFISPNEISHDSYSAPELFSDENKRSNKSDVWALGCLLFKLIFD